MFRLYFSNMWFQLQLNSLLPPVLFLVGRGEDLHVKSVDIVFCLEKDESVHVQEHVEPLAVQGKNVLLPEGYSYPPKTLNCYLVDIFLTYKQLFSENEEVEILFHKILKNGFAQKLRMRKFVLSLRKCPLLLSVEEPNDSCVSVIVWIIQFVRDQELYREEVQKNLDSATSMEAASSSTSKLKRKLETCYFDNFMNNIRLVESDDGDELSLPVLQTYGIASSESASGFSARASA